MTRLQPWAVVTTVGAATFFDIDPPQQTFSYRPGRVGIEGQLRGDLERRRPGNGRLEPAADDRRAGHAGRGLGKGGRLVAYR